MKKALENALQEMWRGIQENTGSVTYDTYQTLLGEYREAYGVTPTLRETNYGSKLVFD